VNTKWSGFSLDTQDPQDVFIKICAGAIHTLALINYQGQKRVFATGASQRGQLGYRTSQNREIFKAIILENVYPNLKSKTARFEDIAAAWDASLLLVGGVDSKTPDRTRVLVMGSSNNGLKGGTNVHSPVLAIDVSAQILRIESEPRHVAIVTGKGELAAWGAGESGQITMSTGVPPLFSPIRLDSDSNHHTRPEAFALGYSHTVLHYEMDGSSCVFLMGSNSKGRLADNRDDGLSVALCTLPDKDEEIHPLGSRVFANWNTTFMLSKNAETLYSCGSGGAGQLGRTPNTFWDGRISRRYQRMQDRTGCCRR
jgi:alpha-tubulin suppressor-like RCC1 family protein